MGAPFFFVQPDVVSTCNVTERICYVNFFFAAVFRKGVWEFVWIFESLEQFWGVFPKVCGVVIAGFFK